METDPRGHLQQPNALGSSQKSPDQTQLERLTHTRVKVRIPKCYHQEPVISRLVSCYGLTVNIAAALLGANARDDGWFDLELRGTAQQIRGALAYFKELDLETWDQFSPAESW